MNTKQDNMGCSGCLYAGWNTTNCYKGSRPLNEQENERLQRSGLEYFCLRYNQPVTSDKGKTCPLWKDDMSFT